MKCPKLTNNLKQIKGENKNNKEDCLPGVYLITDLCIRSVRAPSHLNGNPEKLIKDMPLMKV